jgi:integrase
MSTSTCVTVNAILTKYEQESLPRLAPRTQKDYARHLRVLRREFGERVVDELRPKDFGPFLNVTEGPVQRVRQLAVLSAAFSEAVSRWYMIERNVLRDVKRPRFKPRDRLISDEEFAAIKALAPKRVQCAMMLALLTGQRQGDVIRFKWTDIRDGALHVHQQKTGKRLAIELNPELKKALGQSWQLKGSGSTGGKYVLPTRTGKPYTSEGFRSCWQRVHRQWLASGGEIAHFHDIRALAATRCATPEIAMRLLGHTTLAMTMRVYRRGIERVKALSL